MNQQTLALFMRPTQREEIISIAHLRVRHCLSHHVCALARSVVGVVQVLRVLVHERRNLRQKFA